MSTENRDCVLYEFRLVTALACVISSKAQRSREIWLLYNTWIRFEYQISPLPALRGRPVEMTKVHNLIVFGIIPNIISMNLALVFAVIGIVLKAV